MNAMIFFWARFSTLTDVYMWLNFGTALCYTARSAMFLVDLILDSSLQSRKDYFQTHQYTTYVISALAVAFVTLEWVEWAYIPTWILVGWVCCIGLNVYHWFSLEAYVQAAENSGTNFNTRPAVDDSVILSKLPAKKSKTDDLDSIFESFNLNKID